MVKRDFSPAAVELSRDKLAEASDLADQIYGHVRLMAHGEQYQANKELAKSKCRELLGRLDG